MKSIRANPEEQGSGIWISHAVVTEDEIDNDSNESDEDEENIATSTISDEETSDEDRSIEAEHDSGSTMIGTNAFGALSVDDVEEDEENEGQDVN